MPRYVSLHEIMAMLEEDDTIEASAIVIQPPENATGSVSDEDSGEEDGGTINNLPGSLLRAPAVLIQNYVEFEIDDPPCFPECESTPEAGASTSTAEQHPPAKKKKIAKVQRQWNKKDLATQHTTGRIAQVSDEILSKMSQAPTKILELFLDDEVIELIVMHSNLYAAGKDVVLGLTASEFKCFLAIIFLSGYVPVPRWRMFWERRSDAHNALVSGAMRRNRFETIFSHLHVADNANLDSADKFAKLRPLISILNKRCMEYVPNEACFSFDESMVPYYERHGCK